MYRFRYKDSRLYMVIAYTGKGLSLKDSNSGEKFREHIFFFSADLAPHTHTCHSPLSMASKNSSLLPARMASMTWRCERSPAKLSILLATEGCGVLGSALLPSTTSTTRSSTRRITSRTDLGGREGERETSNR